VCSSVLQCVVVWCSVMQCVAICCSEPRLLIPYSVLQSVAECCNVCSVLQCVAMWIAVWSVCCSEWALKHACPIPLLLKRLVPDIFWVVGTFCCYCIPFLPSFREILRKTRKHFSRTWSRVVTQRPSIDIVCSAWNVRIVLYSFFWLKKVQENFFLFCFLSCVKT